MASALLFPGQGSQQSDMRELVQRERPDLLVLARELLGTDPFEQLRAGTAYMQPAIFCASIAHLARCSEDPDYYAGHSLGEISALVAAQSIAAEDGLRLVVARGRLMQRVAENGPPGAMLAVGVGAPAAEALAAEFDLHLANDNSPEQVVLSGPAAAIEHARRELRSRGLRASRLPVESAFHTPALAPSLPEFRAALDAVEVRPPRRPVLSGVTARDFDDIRRLLAESLTNRVRWRELVQELRRRGVERFVEVGPGQALTKLVQRTLPGVEAHAARFAETVDA